MITAQTKEARQEALDKLLPMQQVTSCIRAMGGLPVTIAGPTNARILLIKKSYPLKLQNYV